VKSLLIHFSVMSNGASKSAASAEKYMVLPAEVVWAAASRAKLPDRPEMARRLDADVRPRRNQTFRQAGLSASASSIATGAMPNEAATPASRAVENVRLFIIMVCLT
jgi:hypothetical protein